MKEKDNSESRRNWKIWYVVSFLSMWGVLFLSGLVNLPESIQPHGELRIAGTLIAGLIFGVSNYFFFRNLARSE